MPDDKVRMCPLPGCDEPMEICPQSLKWFCPLCGRFYTLADIHREQYLSQVGHVNEPSCSTSE